MDLLKLHDAEVVRSRKWMLSLNYIPAGT